MTLQERLERAHIRSKDLYLRLQALEQQRQDIIKEMSDVQTDLLKLDGEVKVLTELTTDASHAE